MQLLERDKGVNAINLKNKTKNKRIHLCSPVSHTFESGLQLSSVLLKESHPGLQRISETHEKEKKDEDLCRSLVFSPAKPSRSLQNIFLQMYRLIDNDVWEDLSKM